MLDAELHARLRAILEPRPADVNIRSVSIATDPLDRVVTFVHVGTRRSLEIAVRDLLEAGRQVFDVLDGRRNCRVLTHISRIVGYFSFMHVWNRSKLAEARDRHRGDYGVREAA